PARGLDGVADAEMIVVALERMPVGDRRRRALHPAPRQRRQPRRRSLHRRALHVMKHGAQAAELLAAPGATGTAMHDIWQRRTMPGGCLGAVAVDDQYATVIRRDAENHSLGDRGIIGEQRRNQTALAAPD